MAEQVGGARVVATTVDVRVVRWLDGYRITHTHAGLTNAEALVLKYAEQCLPGELVVFDKVPTPRPWEALGAADDPGLDSTAP